MSSYPLIITRNKQNSLFEAIVASFITAFLSYGLLTNLSSSRLGNRLNILFLMFCAILTGILWFKYFQKNSILVKITEAGISFKKEEIKWESIVSYRITEYISDGITRHIYFKLKDREEELKFYLPEFDVPVDILIKTINTFSDKYGFSFQGTSTKP